MTTRQQRLNRDRNLLDVARRQVLPAATEYDLQEAGLLDIDDGAPYPHLTERGRNALRGCRVEATLHGRRNDAGSIATISPEGSALVHFDDHTNAYVPATNLRAI